MLTDFTQKSPLYFCEKCNTKTNNKKDFDKHLLTAKHKKLTNVNDMLTDFHKNMPNCIFICKNCNTNFKHSSSLSRHKKKCQQENQEINNEIPQITPELIMSVLQQNKELQQMLVEQNKTIIELSKNNTMTNCNNTTNSHNKSFNLNFFLNETCKDAMNIMDFVDSIKIQLSDLEKVGKNGFVEGISSIIVKNLNSLDESKRPVHCTDSKREVMYVKDENKWEKENENNVKIRKAIKKVAYKNTKILSEFRTSIQIV